MFILMFAGYQAFSAARNDEKRGAVRRIGQNGVKLRHTAVGDELLLAVDPVPFNLTLLIQNPFRLGLQRLNIAARLRFGNTIGDHQAFIGNLPNILFFLLRGGAHPNGVHPQTDGQKRRGHRQVHLGHPLAYDGNFRGACAQAPVSLRNKNEVERNIRTQHKPDQLGWKRPQAIHFELCINGKFFFLQFINGIQNHVQKFRVHCFLMRHK